MNATEINLYTHKIRSLNCLDSSFLVRKITDKKICKQCSPRVGFLTNATVTGLFYVL